MASGDYTGDSETEITVSFTVGGSGNMCHTNNKGVTTCDVALWFGAHVADSTDWGTGTGAANISGSPYHVALAKLDGASVGQRDNQMQGNAIIPTAHLKLVKTVTNDTGGTAVATDFTLSAAGPTPISGAGGAESDVDAGAYTLTSVGFFTRHRLPWK
jgi:hypothetical protein